MSSQKVGRNSLCPCGSGKKYKHCCGDFYQSGIMFYHDEQPLMEVGNPLTVHKDIAYSGRIGRMRAEFCRQYLLRKQTVFERMEKDLFEKTSTRRESITCREGCSYCCSQYISGTLHEAELIIYYLYQHEDVLSRFTMAYPAWRQQIKKNEDIFNKLETYFGKLVTEGESESNRRAYQEATTRYLSQNIPCPFLDNGSCSIYDVRPFCCASIVATTPGEFCSPVNEERPRIYGSSLRPKEVPFFRHTKDLVIVPIPLSVYQLLYRGYGWLSGIPGLDGLVSEVANDPEIKNDNKFS